MIKFVYIERFRYFRTEPIASFLIKDQKRLRVAVMSCNIVTFMKGEYIRQTFLPLHKQNPLKLEPFT